jgi:RNA polymerase sigma-70 factor (ECF subfamily)
MPETSTGLLCAARDCANDDAWRRLVGLYEPLLQGWLRRQSVQHADADDLVEDTLATVARQLPAFRHNGRPGAFRSWLRGILANRLRTFRRSRRVRFGCRTVIDLDRLADVLADPESELSRGWDEDHDRFVARQLLERLEPEFQAKTWQAFRRVVIDGAKPDHVAAELGVAVASVYAAKSRVLKRLREEAATFLD